MPRFPSAAESPLSISGELSGSRANNTIYQNTSTQTLVVVYSGRTAAAGNETAGFIGVGTPPTSKIDRVTCASNYTDTIILIVPSQWYYKIESGWDDVRIWYEYLV